jgi:hypothetical protein
MFAVGLGISRAEMVDLSIPLMVDHVDWWTEMKEASHG